MVGKRDPAQQSPRLASDREPSGLDLMLLDRREIYHGLILAEGCRRKAGAFGEVAGLWMTLNGEFLLALQHGVDIRGRNAGFQLSHFAATPGDDAPRE